MTQLQQGRSGRVDLRRRVMSTRTLSCGNVRDPQPISSSLLRRRRKRQSGASSDVNASSWTVVVAVTAAVTVLASTPATASRMATGSCFATVRPSCVTAHRGPFPFSKLYSTVADVDTETSPSMFSSDENLAKSFALAASSFEVAQSSMKPSSRPSLLWFGSSKEGVGMASPYANRLSEKTSPTETKARRVNQRPPLSPGATTRTSIASTAELARRGRIEISQASGKLMKNHRRSNRDAEAIRRRRVLVWQSRVVSSSDSEVYPEGLDENVEEVSFPSPSVTTFSTSASEKVAKSTNSQRTLPGFARLLTHKEDGEERRRKATEVSKEIDGSGVANRNPELELSQEMKKIPRLSLEEELHLGTLTQEGLRCQRLYDSLSQQLKRPPTEEEWCDAAGELSMESLRQKIEDGLEAKKRIVRGNLRMVRSVVNVYVCNGIGTEYNVGDLIQEGTMALIRAAEKFEPSRGHRFSTYAMYWIRSAVKSSQLGQSRLVHVPEKLLQNTKRVNKVKRKLRSRLGRSPTTDEIARETGLTLSEVTRIHFIQSQTGVSFDVVVTNKKTPNGGGRQITLSDWVSNKIYDEEQVRRMNQQLLKEDLVRILNEHLSPHCVDLVLLRFGLMDEGMVPSGFSGRPISITKVSKLVGLPPTTVRRMLGQSLRKLRPVLVDEWAENFGAMLE